MGALPAAATKANLDTAIKDPKQARSELADHIDKFNEMRTYLSGLFGTDGTPATARTNLGVDAKFAAGIEQIFGNTIPAGWTHNTARNDEVVRIVSGVGNGTGGTVSIAGGADTVGGTAITTAQLAQHNHTVRVYTEQEASTPTGAGPLTGSNNTTGNTGSGSTHPHGFTYKIKHRDYRSATHD